MKYLERCNRRFYRNEVKIWESITLIFNLGRPFQSRPCCLLMVVHEVFHRGASQGFATSIIYASTIGSLKDDKYPVVAVGVSPMEILTA